MLSDNLSTEVFVFGNIDLIAVVEKLLFSFEQRVLRLCFRLLGCLSLTTVGSLLVDLALEVLES
jgi:hypothetical protein